LKTIRDEMPPLRGVVHCAAVIEDAALANMSPERFRAVLQPKVLGAWNLDRLTRDAALDFFVLYSSAATLVGNPGQSNYAAANLYLEALAEQRRAAGLPALAMLWGAIEGVGHLARHADVAKTMTERLGVKLLAPARAFERLEQAMVAGAGQVAVAELNWSKLALLPQLAKSPKYSLVRPAPGESSREESYDTAKERELLAALPPGERFQYVQQSVLRQLATVLRMPVSKLGVGQSLLDLGMDSLMVVELQVAVEHQFGITIQALEFMDIATVEQLVGRVAGKLGVEPTGAPQEAGSRTESIDVDSLPTEALDDMLAKLLEGKSGPAAGGAPA
jgi:acyl carrier protein